MSLSDDAKAAAASDAASQETEQFACSESRGTAVLTMRSKTVRTLDEALTVTEADLTLWEVERWVGNKWDSVAKITVDGDDTLAATELWQIKVWFRRKPQEALGLEKLLDDIANARSVKIKRRKFSKARGKKRFALEIAIMDPHMGLDCFLPQSDQKWNADLCEQFYLFAVSELIRRAEFTIAGEKGELTEIVWPFGNDFLHVDNVQHTTTAGTVQPEAISTHEAAYRGEQLAITAADMMLKRAPVKAYQIPGNHDRYSNYFMGRVLNAWYRHDDNFEIDASASPFKRWRFGQNLVMFEHGHSINPLRFAALMANEWRHDWAETEYREIHCGDQHRKGSSKPSVFEEQGVSVEFLPGLVAPNEWHKLKAFNFQKRAATGFLWDKEVGCVDRLSVNISQYTGTFMDSKKFDEWNR